MKARTLAIHRASALLPFLAVVGLCGSAPAVAQAPWPTEAWAPSTPGAQGMDIAPLEELDRKIQDGRYGNVDRLVVVLNGYLVMSRRYPNDYRMISTEYWAGQVAPDTVSRPFNYQHRDHHPWYMDGDVHTLQSVTIQGVITHGG